MTLTSFGKIEARGQAGKHGLGFEHPQGHPKHSLQGYILTTGKAGAKNTTSGIFSASLAIRHGWAGPCGTMWRLAHDLARHVLYARKPFVIHTESIILKQGAPTQVLWLKKGDISAIFKAVLMPAITV